MMQGAMNPDFLLGIIAAITGFLLKSTLAFAACAAVSRLTQSPKLRFVLWSGFVYGTALYWLYLAGWLWNFPQQSTAVMVASPPLASSLTTHHIPASIPATFATPLGLIFRALGIGYLLAVGYSVFTHLKRRRNLQWVLKFASEPPAEIVEIFQSVAQELNAGRARLLLLSGATSPVTFGWVRPTVLLPSSCVEEDRSELEDILRHELHHVRRGDSIWNELALAARGLLMFHPAIWFAVRKMQFDRELACDFAVVAQRPARRLAYAECLIRFARLNVVPESNSWGIDFAASAHHLTVRVHSILAAPKASPVWTRYLRIASGLTISALFLGIAPSLAVLLTFAHPPDSSLRPVPSALPAESRKETTTSRRAHALPSSVKGRLRAEALTPGPREADQLQADSQEGMVTAQISSQNASGPQLHRRGDPSASGSKPAASQTIALVDTDAKGQPVKSADNKQTVQQTATAALGIYKRLSSLDRH
jgi:beta-lactamase regulating signal transducer with metallopeptidase domain